MPTFTGLVVPDAQAFLADWEETLLEYDCVYFVAELEGRVVGHLALYPEEPNLATPPGSVVATPGASRSAEPDSGVFHSRHDARATYAVSAVTLESGRRAGCP